MHLLRRYLDPSNKHTPNTFSEGTWSLRESDAMHVPPKMFTNLEALFANTFIPPRCGAATHTARTHLLPRHSTDDGIVEVERGEPEPEGGIGHQEEPQGIPGHQGRHWEIVHFLNAFVEVLVYIGLHFRLLLRSG